MMKRFIALSVLLLTFTPSALATPFTNLYNFGDSLSDTGNLLAITGGTLPPPPYATGRVTSNFSNGDAGMVWYDEVASQLGFSSGNSLAGGNNYAFAGARTGGVPAPGTVPSLLLQTQLFLGDVGGVADSNALYSIWGGGNDIRDNNIGNTVANISAIITQLHGAGAMNFFLPNQTNIGLTPESLAGFAPGGSSAEITAASLQFNMDLLAELQMLEANLGINIIKFDIFSLFNDVVADPASFGFTNLTDPCLNQIAGTLCADPDSYLYFDGIHPTAAAHKIIGERAFATIMDAMSVPAPATLALLLSGLTIISLRRKKAA